MNERWDSVCDEALRIYFENDYTDDEIGETLGFTPEWIAKKRRDADLLRSRGRRWTQEQTDALLDPENRTLPSRALAALIGTDVAVVHRKRQQLGLPTGFLRRWTPEEIEFLKQHYPTKGSAYVAKALDWPQRSVENKVSSLGLQRRKG
jgi:hypothetical protein